MGSVTFEFVPHGHNQTARKRPITRREGESTWDAAKEYTRELAKRLNVPVSVRNVEASGHQMFTANP